jgi:hypothetical protein
LSWTSASTIIVVTYGGHHCVALMGLPFRGVEQKGASAISGGLHHQYLTEYQFKIPGMSGTGYLT